MAEAKKKKSTKKKATKKRASRKKVEAGTRGLAPTELTTGEAAPEVDQLSRAIVDDGGQVLARYRDPLGGHWQLLAVLPLDKVEPTPFQRDLSAAHAKRMTEVIDKLDRFLDPILAVRPEAGGYWTPNGLHRLTALQQLGAKSVVALVLPDFRLCYKILALNTEKAHNLKEKSLEVIRMARALADLSSEPADSQEDHYSLEFEEPSFLTLGICYEQRPRFSGSAYNPILSRCDAFLPEPLSETLKRRNAWATKLLEVDDAVATAVSALKERGLESPYLKNFVVARANPLRKKDASHDIDSALETMLEKLEAFDPDKVSPDQIRANG